MSDTWKGCGIAMIVVFVVTVVVIAVLAAMYVQRKCHAASPPPRLAGAGLPPGSCYESCRGNGQAFDPAAVDNCTLDCEKRSKLSLVNRGPQCIRVLVANNASMAGAAVYDVGARQDGSIVECGAGRWEIYRVVDPSSWLVVEQRYLGSSYDITYPFQIDGKPWTSTQVLRPAMQLGTQQHVIVDPTRQTITVGTPPTGSGGSGGSSHDMGLAGAGLQSDGCIDTCLINTKANGRTPDHDVCKRECEEEQQWEEQWEQQWEARLSLVNRGPQCIRVLVADNPSMARAQVYDVGARQDGSIVECGYGYTERGRVVDPSSWLVVEQRYLGSSYDITYPFQIDGKRGAQTQYLQPAMQLGTQQLVVVDPARQTITVGTPPAGSGGSGGQM
jgi:hypothetical protein